MSEQEKNPPVSAAPEEQWAFLEDFKWTDTEPGESASKIRRLKAIPVKQAAMDYATEEAVLELSEGLEAHARRLLDNTGPKSFVRIKEVPLLIFSDPKLRIFMEDYTRVNLTDHNSAYMWGFNYGLPDFNPTDGQLNAFLTRSNSLCALKGIASIPWSDWRLCNHKEAQNIFRGSAPGGWGDLNGKLYGVTIGSNARPTEYFFVPSNTIRKFDNITADMVTDIYVADIPNDRPLLTFLLNQGWTPWGANSSVWNTLTDFYERDLISITGETETHIAPTEKLYQAVRDGTVNLPNGQDPLTGSPELFEKAKEAILACDERRANITRYAPMQLQNPNGGSWELWDPPMDGTVMMSIPASEAVYARDPRLDVQEGGIIGIDFGTKSTVVVRQGDSDQIHLVRVGQGSYEKEVSERDYENPTVMEFVNLQRFMEAYRRRAGRPDTLWEDLTVSHTAFDDWKENEESSLYFSFFSDLKQWAGSQGRNIRIRDKEGTTELDLPPYLTLTEGDFDPVELYAYYIGLYINNMFTNQIYLEYLLSFPVTYSQAVRKKILESFRRGLAKSIPEPVLKDPEYGDLFSVEQGAGEPAAYAVCALQEYGFRPAEGESVFYAIFDFGGGTTDFDFGQWRRATKDKKERNYSYVINHFGDGGDQYLGGENLLELLAYRVFCDNVKLLREGEFTFALPPRQEPLDGHEFVLSDSQEARTNMRRVMEELRYLWERKEGYESRYANGILQVSLVKRDGSTVNGVQLHVDTDKLETILRKRITEGVLKFISALRTVFERELFQSQDANHVHIFLAGNSSKSDILQEAFREQLGSFTEDIHKAYRDRGEDQDDQEYFTLYPPLGTEEAQAIMSQRGCLHDGPEDATRPSGKTGVAFGLIQCRSGSKIKVLSEIRAGEEIKFRYWVGDDMDDFFYPFLTRSTGKEQWVEYRSAETKVFEFYYTTNPMAERRKTLPIKDETVSKRRITMPLPASAINEDLSIFLRTAGPDCLQFAVAASQEDADQGNFVLGPQDIVLKQ